MKATKFKIIRAGTSYDLHVFGDRFTAVVPRLSKIQAVIITQVFKLVVEREYRRGRKSVAPPRVVLADVLDRGRLH